MVAVCGVIGAVVGTLFFPIIGTLGGGCVGLAIGRAIFSKD